MISFIGAGPGASDLITLRGLKRLQQADLVVYAGSLIPQELVDESAPNAQKINSVDLVLSEIMEIMIAAAHQGKKIVRLHSGDPSIYGAIGEQCRWLDQVGIDYEIIPGVPAFAAAAAALKRELTLPTISQTVILTRTATRASEMPSGEELASLAAHGGTLVIHLSINNLVAVLRDTMPHYGESAPVAVIYRATWPDELIIRGTLQDIRAKVKEAGITRTALVIIGRVLADENFPPSALYDPNHSHILREKRGDN
ncbi:MAG: precorrin-4 C(11)-methyltransferase [Alphaproteobacteria bacterium]|nr:precorrin-4 C(11)-methyltransferase [Alphaproteobacteria bacterium]